MGNFLLLRLVAACLALASLAACSDNTNLTAPATIENTVRVFSVYALSGTPTALPAAYQFTSESLARPQVLFSGAVNFDVAFDLGADGKVRLLPARALIPVPPAGAPVVGVLKAATSFAALERAPDRGYQVDSVAVAGIGDTYVLQVSPSNCFLNEPFYAKLTIDSIIPTERRIVVRSLVNRNCNYRALTAGIPKT